MFTWPDFNFLINRANDVVYIYRDFVDLNPLRINKTLKGTKYLSYFLLLYWTEMENFPID